MDRINHMVETKLQRKDNMLDREDRRKDSVLEPVTNKW
jgi:hypothetical protein